MSQSDNYNTPITNLGLVLFLAMEYASGAKWGAAVMGIGILLGVGVMVLRLLRIGASETDPAPAPGPVSETSADAATS